MYQTILLPQPLTKIIRAILVQALEQVCWIKVDAAKLVSMDPYAFNRLAKKLSIEFPENCRELRKSLGRSGGRPKGSKDRQPRKFKTRVSPI